MRVGAASHPVHGRLCRRTTRVRQGCLSLGLDYRSGKGRHVKITGFELRRVAVPMIAPFRTSFGVEHHRDILLVRALADEAEGWGECVAMHAPLYSSEYADGA